MSDTEKFNIFWLLFSCPAANVTESTLRYEIRPVLLPVHTVAKAVKMYVQI